MHHHVIGRIQALAVEAVGDDGAAAIMFGSGDRAGAVLTGDETPLPVAGVAIGKVGGRAKNAWATFLVPAVHALIGNVGKQQRVMGGKPDRPFGPAMPG